MAAGSGSIGASTGGPQALLTLLGHLPVDLEQAVLVVQHMAEGFIQGLASWLGGLVPLPVVVGKSGRRLLPGTITLAPSGGSLLVQDDRLRVLYTPSGPGQFHVPGNRRRASRASPAPSRRRQWASC